MQAYTAGLTRGDYDHLCAQGIAIKVPSNRVFVPSLKDHPNGYHAYPPPWDGSFKLERGCTNPAFILADLIARTGAKHDWVTGIRGQRYGGQGEAGYYPNWLMLYDWGRWCDEVVSCGVDIRQNDCPEVWYRGHSPRFAVNTVCQTPADMVRLRETLRMHCLHWQGSDPRWRTSYPVYS